MTKPVMRIRIDTTRPSDIVAMLRCSEWRIKEELP